MSSEAGLERDASMIRVALLDDYQGVALDLVGRDTLGAGVEARAFPDHVDAEQAVVERLAGFEAVVAMRERTPFPARVLERLPRLGLLVTTGMSNASIDTAAATRLGIVVSGTRSVGHPTAELTWGLILALARRLVDEHENVRADRWQTTLGVELHGKVLGVIGLGTLGSRVAAIGRAFGMEVLAWSLHLTAERAAAAGAARVTKEDLLTRSDVVTIHLRLSDRTRGLLGARDLAMMKASAFLVNTSRGPIVDEEALVRALARGTIAGAGVDVYDREPLPAGHPLRRAPNIVTTPHLGYVTRENYAVYYRDAAEDVRAFLDGRPVRVLNPDVLESPARRRPGHHTGRG